MQGLLSVCKAADIEKVTIAICKENRETNGVQVCCNEDEDPMARGGTVGIFRGRPRATYAAMPSRSDRDIDVFFLTVEDRSIVDHEAKSLVSGHASF